MEKTELTVKELMIYNDYLNRGEQLYQGTALCVKYVNFVVGIATNIERLKSVLAKTKAPQSERMAAFETKLMPLQADIQTKKIDVEEFNTSIDVLNKEYAEEIRLRNTFFNAVLSFEPYSIEAKFIPDSLLEEAETTAAQGTDAFNFLTALVKLKII